MVPVSGDTPGCSNVTSVHVETDHGPDQSRTLFLDTTKYVRGKKIFVVTSKKRYKKTKIFLVRKYAAVYLYLKV